MKRLSSFILVALLFISTLLSLPTSASAQTSEQNNLFNASPSPQAVILPGLTFQLRNQCQGIAQVAVGDELCQLKVESATFLRPVYSGSMQSGEKTTVFACSSEPSINSSIAKGLVLFIPRPGTSVSAKQMEVRQNQVVDIPNFDCL